MRINANLRPPPKAALDLLQHEQSWLQLPERELLSCAEQLLQDFACQPGELSLWHFVGPFLARSEMAERQSAWNAAFALARVLEIGLRVRLGLTPCQTQRAKVTWPTFIFLMALRADVACHEILQNAQQALAGRANARRDPEARDKGLRGAAGLVAQAKSIFARHHRKWLPTLPRSIDRFIRSSPIAAPGPEHEAAPVDAFSHFMEALCALAEDPAKESVVLLITMVLYCKCRISDALAAGPDELADTSVVTELVIGGPRHRRKTGGRLVAPILLEVYRFLQERSAGRSHIVAATKAQRDAAKKAANDFLRAHLLPDAPDPLRQLRHYCVSGEEALTGSLAQAQKHFGHASVSTTMRYILPNFSVDHFRLWRACSFLAHARRAGPPSPLARPTTLPLLGFK